MTDEKFKTLVITVLELATQSYELFQYVTLSEKRSLIDFVFSDMTLTGRNLHYSLRKPFDLIVDLSKCEDWLRLISIFRTEKREEVYSFIKNSYNNNIQQTRLVA